jgi:hypothetical protein
MYVGPQCNEVGIMQLYCMTGGFHSSSSKLHSFFIQAHCSKSFGALWPQSPALIAPVSCCFLPEELSLQFHFGCSSHAPELHLEPRCPNHVGTLTE